MQKNCAIANTDLPVEQPEAPADAYKFRDPLIKCLCHTDRSGGIFIR